MTGASHHTGIVTMVKIEQLAGHSFQHYTHSLLDARYSYTDLQETQLSAFLAKCLYASTQDCTAQFD